MKDQWRGSNVDLTQLSEGVKQFFLERQFETEMKKTRLDYQIEAKTERIINAQLKISVRIYGDPNDFTVEYTTKEGGKGFFSSSMILSYIAQALGGGVIFRGELKLHDALDKLEKGFWEHVDNQIAQLAHQTREQAQNNPEELKDKQDAH